MTGELFQQTDTIVLQDAADTVQAVKAKARLTPEQVLSWLPADATPEQQDSAIQAHIKPSEIHWSERPDTLHLPGHPVGKNIMEVNLPQYYRESYFTGRPYFNQDLFGGRLGVAGDPVPYTIAGDNIMTALLLGCFMLTLVVFSRSRGFMLKQAKDFFRAPKQRVTDITETSNEVRFQFFLVLQTCLFLGLVHFFYVQVHHTDTFIIDQYQVIGLYALVALGFCVVRAIAYGVVNWVFFDPQLCERWMKSFLFILSIEGLSLFPFVLLQAYFDMDVESTLTCAFFVVIVFRILLFYKAYRTFFSRRTVLLQLFLYFCALEIVPVAALWGVLGMITGYLKVNF